MAGVYILAGVNDRVRVEAAAHRLKFFEEKTRIIAEPGFCAAWVGHDDPALFGPAFDPISRVRVVTSGRVSWDEKNWKEAEMLVQYEGGLSNRLLLRRYLEGGVAAVERHNGPALLAIWDPRDKVLHLLTDHFGYHPVFLFRPNDPEQTVISTFADAIADDPQVSTTRDLVSAAELLSAWRVTPPHTHYKEIKYAGAATHWKWDLGSRSVSKRVYWQPYLEPRFPNIDAAAEELAAAVSHAIHIRTLSRLGPIVSFTSGGMDSRAVLFASASPSDIIGLNLYDIPNKEAAISRQLCDAAGVRYVGFARDDDYYPRWLPEGSHISGAMSSQEDNHFLGTRDMVMRELGARTVLTACTTDWLFKGYGLEKKYLGAAGRNLPIKVLTHERVEGFLPNYPRHLPQEFQREVQNRLEECFAGTPKSLVSDSDWLLVEDRRVRPACYTVSVSGQIMYRIYPYDTFLADKHVADCYSKSRAEWKLNADLWAKVVRRICRSGDKIEDANFGWRVGSSTPRKLVSFAQGWVRRRIRPSKLPTGGLATDGAWPNLAWYIKNSVTLRARWESVSQETKSLIARVWGGDPWDRPLEAWSDSPNDLFRILTLSLHLDHYRD